MCHSDIHGYNLLIETNGALYIVDWDGLIFAPKERDLMFIGGGHGDSGYIPQEEETMFYQGYGPTNMNQTAIAHYRYERIITDFADDWHPSSVCAILRLALPTCSSLALFVLYDP